jgi:hypothetical protein
MGGSVVLRVTLGAGLAAAVGFAAYALAGPARDAKIEVTRFSVDPGLGGAFAKCSAGRRAVGGGVVDSGRPRVYVAASGPLDASVAGGPLNPSEAVANTKDGDAVKRWYAGVSNGSSRRVAVKVLALCSKASDARIEATSFRVAGRRTGDAFAKCPVGRRAVGGGVVQSGFPDDRVLASGPLDASGAIANTRDGDVAKQWYAAVHNLPNHRVRFKVFALCSADSRATIEATRFLVRGGGTGHASAKCPAGKRALGGGLVEAGPPRFVRMLASAPLDATGVPANTKDGDTAKRWYAAMENRNPGRVYFKVFAICEPG